MGDQSELLGAPISVVANNDVRYEGVLFSVNAAESTIVLREVKVLGTEDRVHDSEKKVAENSAVLPFVTFPSTIIKDLWVHQTSSWSGAEPQPTNPPRTERLPDPPGRIEVQPAPEPSPTPPPAPQVAGERRSESAQKSAPKAKAPADRRPPAKVVQPRTASNPVSAPQGSAQTQKHVRVPSLGAPTPPEARRANERPAAHARATSESQTAISTVAGTSTSQARGDRRNASGSRRGRGGTLPGTGSHLVRMKARGDMGDDSNLRTEFDFEASNEQLEKLAEEEHSKKEEERSGAGVSMAYNKDDFFDSLSCDVSDSQAGVKRLGGADERKLNQETFGATSLIYRRGRGGYRGGKRPAGRFEGRGGSRPAGRAPYRQQYPNTTPGTNTAPTTGTGRGQRGGRGSNRGFRPRKTTDAALQTAVAT